MKKIFKNKKFVIGFIVVLLILVVGICFIVFKNKNNEITEDKVLKKETFTAYIKINPLVKLTFDASYYECTTNDGTVSICGEYTNEVTNVELLNDDANSIYKDIDFKGKSLYDSIIILIETANDNGYDINNINWTTDWNYKADDLKTKVTDKVKEDTNVEVTINFNYQESIDEASILENENTKTYNVIFDSNGGSNIKTESVAQNNVVTKPTDPTKDGYTFVEWQLDGITYNFNTKVTSDITLKAKWDKNSSTSENTDNNNSITDNTTSNSSISNNTTSNDSITDNTTSNDSISSENKSEEPKCIAKKFDKKYSYVYDSMDVCKKKGNDAFNELTDANEPDIFSYGCQEIVDDCGTKWYGVVFHKWSEEQGEYLFYY